MKPVLVPTDIDDPVTGEPLYVSYRLRPRWYIRCRQLWLFLRLLWRYPDDRPCSRIDWATAWEIAFRIMNEQELDPSWRAHVKQRAREQHGT